MQSVDAVPAHPAGGNKRTQGYILDTLIAILGPLLLTGIIRMYHLYPEIPDIIVVYLLLVVALAILRGRFASLLTTVVSFIYFDFFLVEPYFRLSIAYYSDAVALVVFLVTAIIISELASRVRKQARDARWRSRRLSILYELLRAYQATDQSDEQLDVIALSTLRVFSTSGVNECALLLPDAAGTLSVRADAPILVDAMTVHPDELDAARRVYQDGKMSVLPAGSASSYTTSLFPLRQDDRILGVLLLRIIPGKSWLSDEQAFYGKQVAISDQVEFFSIFVHEITTLVAHTLGNSQSASAS